jgi:RNA polymerase sigma-70 factor (ECF subfamily)
VSSATSTTTGECEGVAARMSPSADSDLSAFLAADRGRGFERVVLTYQHRMYGFALRLTGNPQDAEEISQDAFVRAYRAIANYPAERVRALAVRPWLYQIALNVWRNRARVRRPASVPLDDPVTGAPLNLEDDAQHRPDVSAERDERQAELAALLAALPRHFRAAVILRHVEGMSYRELAGILGQPEGTVKAHVHRGTKLLREALIRNANEVVL